MGLASRLSCLVAFLTRIPTRCSSLAEAARGFPLVPVVGLLEGAIAAAVAFAASGLQPLVRGALLLALHLIVTGGLHLDGFADYSDAIGSGLRGGEALRVMRDPCRGSFALAYTSTLLAVKLVGLSYSGPWLLLASYVAAAESMYLAALLAPAVGGGLGATFKSHGVSGRGLALNLALAAASLSPAVYADPRSAAVAASVAAAVAGLVAWDARGRLGGFNGDVLGFTYELVHTASLLAGAMLYAVW